MAVLKGSSPWGKDKRLSKAGEVEAPEHHSELVSSTQKIHFCQAKIRCLLLFISCR